MSVILAFKRCIANETNSEILEDIRQHCNSGLVESIATCPIVFCFSMFFSPLPVVAMAYLDWIDFVDDMLVQDVIHVPQLQALKKIINIALQLAGCEDEGGTTVGGSILKGDCIDLAIRSI